MRGVVTKAELYPELNMILFEVAVYSGSEYICDVPILRNNETLTESEKDGLIMTAIEIAVHRTEVGLVRYAAQTALNSDMIDHEWEETE